MLFARNRITLVYRLELETKVYTKVRNHREGPYPVPYCVGIPIFNYPGLMPVCVSNVKALAGVFNQEKALYAVSTTYYKFYVALHICSKLSIS